jgi:hypothetical protein
MEMNTILGSIAGALLLAPLALGAQAVAMNGSDENTTPASRAPQVQPRLHVAPAPGKIVIDGELDDAGWENAAVATGFSEFQPREGVPAPVPIEAWVTYDQTHLYVAFRITEDPAAIRATLRNRDNVLGDDLVGVILDPFGNNATGYIIAANPLGVQLDGLLTATGDDFGFDLIYESAGRITENGYQVELAIPFASIQFPKAHEQEWRLNFVKLHPRSTMRQYSWGVLTQNESCFLCQNGRLTGLEGIQAGRRIELLPSLVASQAAGLRDSDDPASFGNDDPSAAVSLGVRYPFRPGWTLEATYNPDFSQVESDAAQIDVNTTFALSYPERRPFFQEGGELFQTSVSQVYTRAINSPIGAAKLVGREGRTSVGYIGAVDERTPILVPLEERSLFVAGDRSMSNILRVRQAVGDASHVGVLLTDRRYDGGGAGSTVGIDARLNLGHNWRLSAQLVGSRTTEPESGDLDDYDLSFGAAGHTVAFDGESFNGLATHVSLSRYSQMSGIGVTYRDASPTFRTGNGFQSRNDFRNASAFVQRSYFPAGGFVDRATLSLQGNQGWSYQGVSREQFLSPALHLQMRGQTNASIGARHGQERFDGTRFRDLTTGWANVSSAFSDKVTINLSASGGDWIYRRFGDAREGTGRSASTSLELKPTAQVIVEPMVAYQRMTDRQGEELFAGYVARTRLSYQFTREMFARVVVQYNDFSDQLTVEPLIMYRLNPFSILYLGSTHGYGSFDHVSGYHRTDRQFFLKLQYLFSTRSP